MRSELKRPILYCGICLSMFVTLNSFAQERVVYKCTDATGSSEFSDKECAANASPINLNTPVDEALSKQKAEHDARVLRDKVLADQLEAKRLAAEQAGRAAQDQQMQVNRALAEKYEQERNLKNSSVVSSPNVTQPAPILTVP